MLTIGLHNDNIFRVDKRETQNVVEKGKNKVVNTQLLEDKIVNSGKKKSYLADKIGISIQSLRLKILNKSDFKLSEATILCNELCIDTLEEKEKIFFKK